MPQGSCSCSVFSLRVEPWVADGRERPAGRRDLTLILVGRMVLTFGDGMALVALTLRLQADGADPYQVGLLLGAGVVPLLLLARPVGRLVDAYDSRRLLVGGGLVEVAATIPLVFLHSVVPIVVLAAVLGGAASMTAATWSALLPRLVGDDRLAQAVSAQASLTVLALVGAPAVGGLLAGAFGSGVPVAIDAATFVVVTVAAALVRTRRVPSVIPPWTGRSRPGVDSSSSGPTKSWLRCSRAWRSSYCWSAWSTSCLCIWSA